MQHKFNKFFLLLLFGFSQLLFAAGMPPAVVQVEEAVNIEIAPFIWVPGNSNWAF